MDELQELQEQDLRYEEALHAYDMQAAPDDFDGAIPLEDLDIRGEQEF